MRFLLPIFVIGTTLFAGCSKNDGPRTQSLHLVEVKTTAADTTQVTRFSYDAASRLIVYTDSSNKNQLKQVVNLDYNAAGQLMAARYSILNSFLRTDSFFTNSAGQVTSRVSTYGSATTRNVYTYNSSGQLVSDTIYYQPTGLAGYSTYEYFNGDLVKWNSYGATPFGGGIGLLGSVQYSYNGNANPYHHIALPLYFINGLRYAMSMHTPVTETITAPGAQPNSNTYSYTLNSAGMVSNATIIRGNYLVGKLVTFSYE